jgi:predicted amidophosphoribosyltransferase
MGVIIRPGDRRNTGFCLMCGTDLIVPWNDYQCCSGCTDKLEYHKKFAEMNKSKKRNRTILKSKEIMRQIKPIGGVPEGE